jgi:hypothetical protein
VVTEYVLPLSHGVRKRHHHETRKGAVISFSVQLEVIVEGKWRPVIRYNSAHGFAHKDTYNRDGKCTKTDLHLYLDEALTIADEDIKNNWETYRDQFFKGE